MAPPTIFTRFLRELGVPHTDEYSDARFRKMTFKSLFGLSHLLTDFGVRNEGLRITDKSELTLITPPFLAQTKGGIFVIVTDIDIVNGKVSYDSLGEKLTADISDFSKAWNGVVLLAFPDKDSREPEYASHHLTEIVKSLSKYALMAVAAFLFIYFFVVNGVYAHVSTVLLALFNCLGLWFSYMLMQKSLNIHTSTSDKVCGVLEHGGCDSIMQLKVSKLFGVFSWSEVGFGYFGISLATLLLFPHMLPALALCNICCLPYTVWSIWYQKFRARHWCTLCVGVQSTLWALFFCYLLGGWTREAFPIGFSFLVLVAVYVFAVLLINQTVSILKNLPEQK